MGRHHPSKWPGLFGLTFLAFWLAVTAAQETPTGAGGSLQVDKAADFETGSGGFNFRALANTALLCSGVILLAVPPGMLLALALTRTDLPGSRAALVIIIFLLFLPLYVQVAGWEAAFGKLGWLTSFTRSPLLSGMRAVIVIHALAAVPWVVLIVSIGLALVRREEEEVALLDAAGPTVIARVVLPQIAPFVLAAALLAAISAASEMTVTNIYLVDPGDYTLAEQVYMTLQAQPLGVAVAQSLPSILATIVLIAGGLWGVMSLAPLEGRIWEDRQQPLIYRLGVWKAPVTLLIWLLLAALVGLPVASLIYKAGTLVIWDGETPARTWSLVKSLSMPWTALWNVRSDVRWTVVIGASAATLSLLIAIGVAHFVRGKTWKNWLVLSVVASGWAIPGPVVGLAIIALMNHDLPGLGWLYERTDVPAIMAQSVRALPIVMLVVFQSLEHFPKSTLEAAQLDGAGRWSILGRIILPQRVAALLIAWIVGFAIATGDLAWSILVLRPGVDTLQRRLFGDIHAGADDRVAAICLAISVVYAIGAAGILLQWRRYAAERK